MSDRHPGNLPVSVGGVTALILIAVCVCICGGLLDSRPHGGGPGVPREVQGRGTFEDSTGYLGKLKAMPGSPRPGFVSIGELACSLDHRNEVPSRSLRHHRIEWFAEGTVVRIMSQALDPYMRRRHVHILSGPLKGFTGFVAAGEVVDAGGPSDPLAGKEGILVGKRGEMASRSETVLLSNVPEHKTLSLPVGTRVRVAGTSATGDPAMIDVVPTEGAIRISRDGSFYYVQGIVGAVNRRQVKLD